VYEEDEVTGEQVYVDLEELPLVETGQFDNVQSDPRRRPFSRDDLLEPEGSKMTLEIYRNHVTIRSSALKKSTGKRVEREPQVQDWLGTTESFWEAKESGLTEEVLRENWSRFREKGPRSGTRKAINTFTRVSRERLK